MREGVFFVYIVPLSDHLIDNRFYWRNEQFLLEQFHFIFLTLAIEHQAC